MPTTRKATPGEDAPPSAGDLAAELGAAAKKLWDDLLESLAALGVTVHEWKRYSQKAPWSLRVKHKDRAIVYLLPQRGGFIASFALGDRAMQAARAAGLPKTVLAILDSAKRYAEGTAVRIEVKARRDVDTVERLAAIKLAH